MRIIRGKLKSRRFSIPKKFPSRPTTDFAKEGLFNFLENQLYLDELEVLDLCAGTGNISFEFISRDTKKVIAVDRDYNCVKFIRETSKSFGIEEDIEVIKMDILQYLNKTETTFDLIFADPPYDYKSYDKLAEIVFSRNLLNEDGILILEHSKYVDLSSLSNFDKVKPYGNVIFSFFQQSN